MDYQWHSSSLCMLARHLRADLDRGLSTAEAAQRLARQGRNEIVDVARRSPWGILLDQFRDFMIVILLGAAVISGFIGDLADTLVILVIVVLNAVIGFVQEYRAERAIAALKAMAAPGARVVRDGSTHEISSAELVPGDVVLLEAGNAVPADVRLIEAIQLKIEEAALTGESQPTEKHNEVLDDRELPLADRQNMAYKGTLVVASRGRALVVATGMHTELGRIAQLLSESEEMRTPLQKRLAHFGKVLSLSVLAICGVLFLVGLLRGEPVLLMGLTAISLAVAAIPEALPAVVTVSLALGARRMVATHVLIRKLPAVETLGSVTYICSDKTGTLTLNRMQVERLWADGMESTPLSELQPKQEPWHSLLQAMAVSNDSIMRNDGSLLGDPTEVALHRAAWDAGYDKAQLLQSMPRIGEIAFDAQRARMLTIHRVIGEGVVVYVKGAPEQVLALCKWELGRDGRVPLQREIAEHAAQRMANDGLRVLAFACREVSDCPMEAMALERDLTLLGLTGMLDPPRPEAAEAVTMCRSAGITPVMITGDHPATARAVARRIGIADDSAEVLHGAALSAMTPEALAQCVERVRVYARSSPEQKIKIVQALQERGQFVAMTGDGVNDAPALKRADIGVAMGLGGTDAAKEAAHMILLDDNFASIVGAVREGRRIFDNIRKFIRYTMTSNSGEIWTLFLAPFLGLPIPLLPIHILWINLVTDGLPGLALAVEREERGIMQRPPRPPRESIFAHGMWQHMVWIGLLMGGVCLISQAVALQRGWHWQTIVFNVLTLSQLGHVLAIRSERDSLFMQGIASNVALLAAVLFTFVLQLALVYVPWLNTLFKTAPLSATELGFCLAMSSIVFLAVELEKWLIRRGVLYRESVGG